jgi:hypothetical protein
VAASFRSGKPEHVAASATRRDGGVDLNVLATLTYPHGRFAHLAASMVAFLEPTASVSGSHGWATMAAPFWATDRYALHNGTIPDALLNPAEVIADREGWGSCPCCAQSARRSVPA